MNNASHPLRAKIPAGIGILLITLFVVGAIVFTRNAPAPTQSASAPTATTSHSHGTYKDGTYTQVGSYSSPAGPESISVTLTVANNTVTNSTVTRKANDPTAISYQTLFIGGYKGKVDGKKLDDIHLTNVSGSSLTPIGFMDALSKIQDDAKA